MDISGCRFLFEEDSYMRVFTVSYYASMKTESPFFPLRHFFHLVALKVVVEVDSLQTKVAWLPHQAPTHSLLVATVEAHEKDIFS